MLQHAVLVKDDFILSSRSISLYEGDINVDCNAIMMIFVKMKQEEIKDSVIYTEGCPGLSEIPMLIMAEIKKLVISREPITSDEMCAIELLREHNIPVTINPNISL